MIAKVVSGGQTGADQAGLKAAFDFGIITGGYAPKNFETSEGPNRQLLQKKYGLVEYGEGYGPRTVQNVKASDGTIRLAVDFQSPGEVLTLKAIEQYNKPWVDIHLDNPPEVIRLYSWIMEHNINILNIAGNTEGKLGKPIFKMTYDYLHELFTLMKEKA